MKKNILIAAFSGVVLACFVVDACTQPKDDDDESVDGGEPTSSATPLEGTWLLQNIPTGGRMKFVGETWTMTSGTVKIEGVYLC